MEVTPKQLVSSISKVNVSQLDKINAIPNRTNDNILMDDLSPEDKHYLSALMDNDSSEQEDEGDPSRRSSAWSPMIQSPVVMNKRIKKLRPPYAITLSLEDMSYIRPSWGISKGIRTIEINKRKKKRTESSESENKADKKESADKSGSNNDQAYYYFLFLLIIVLLILTVPTYIVDKKKEQAKIFANKIRVSASSRTIEIYKPSSLDSILQIQFGQGIPSDLKPEQCTCDIYSTETKRYNKNENDTDYCFACLDWAIRANLRIQVEHQKEDKNSFCYKIKWQSYDTLLTPLVDCFLFDNEQWFGLGDVQASSLLLNKLQVNWTTIATNLSSEFSQTAEPIEDSAANSLAFGSHVNFSLFSSGGLHVGDIKTDFDLSFKISQDQQAGSSKRMCISASCNDKCTSTWNRVDRLNEFKYQNNILEYRICTSNNLKGLISKQIDDRTRAVAEQIKRTELSDVISVESNNSIVLDRLIEKEAKIDATVRGAKEEANRLGLVGNETLSIERRLPEKIGLIDRTIFATSAEFMPVLDGQTLRQYVDSIVKLGLKTSSILLIDTRWETFVGSLKLNIGMFPKSKLLFGLLHNKGFKIVFTIKPYIDSGIGISNINQLVESARLYTASYKRDSQELKLTTQEQQQESKSVRESIIRRQSLFTFQNQSIEIGLNDSSVKFPYMFKCKESQEGYCVLLDLTQAANRAWLINIIRRSNLPISEADGIQIGGAHPNNFYWDDHYRAGVSELAQSLFYKEGIFTLAQWTGDFNYIQLAPRRCDWNGLRSVVNSVLNLGMLGFSLIHPGSVWGDLKSTTDQSNETENYFFKPIAPKRMESIYKEVQPDERADKELFIRWLQVAVFLPILQFNNIAPIERHNLQELVGSLVRLRKLSLVPELKKNLPFTPLINDSEPGSFNGTQLPLIRPVWYSQDGGDTVIIPEQFTIGNDILVAPILYEGLRQRDIYLPNGLWLDELRNINIRGGKWLRNYPIELSEIAWFIRIRR